MISYDRAKVGKKLVNFYMLTWLIFAGLIQFIVVIVFMCVYTASGSVDFTFTPRSITFPMGETEYMMNVEINDDNIFELGNESFTLCLKSIQSPVSLPIAIVDGITTVVILDDDRKYSLFYYNFIY